MEQLSLSSYQIVKGTPWSSGIGTSVSECKSLTDVLDKSNLNFHVSKCNASMRLKLTEDDTVGELRGSDFIHDEHLFRVIPKQFVTYRTDTKAPLGIVNNKYTIVQNKDAFECFEGAIRDGYATWDIAGYFGNGQKVFISAKLTNTINVAGDEVDNYLVFSTSHDGSSSVKIMFTPIRVKCCNMLNAALRSAHSYISFKHTINADNKIKEAAEILNVAWKKAKDSEQLYNALTYIKMSDEDVMKYISSIFLSDEEYNAILSSNTENKFKRLFLGDSNIKEELNISTRKANICNSVMTYYYNGAGQKEIAGNAWGAYNAITGYFSNVIKLDGEKRTESLLWGNANSTMQKALVNAHEYGLY